MPKPSPLPEAPEHPAADAPWRPLPEAPPRLLPPPLLAPRLAFRPLLFGAAVVGVAVLCVTALVLRPPAVPDEPTMDELLALQHAGTFEAPADAPAPLGAVPEIEPVAPPAGELHVTTTPSGTAVWLNGRPVGYTPLRLPGLPEGAYAVTMQRPSYAPFDTSIYLAAGSTHALEALLVPAESTGSASASMAGASTPRRASTRPTPPPVRTRPRATETRRVESGQAARSAPRQGGTAFARRVQRTGSLYAVSEPSGAEVYVDGTLRGRAPLALNGLPPGTHTISFSLPDHAPITRRVRVTAGAVDVVRGTLARSGSSS